MARTSDPGGEHIQCRRIEVWQAEPGDIVANLGIVTDRTEVGVFVVLTVRGSVYSLGSGRIDVAQFDVIRHKSETVDLVPK